MQAGELAPRRIDSNRPTMLFVGDHTCFSDVFLRLIQSEFPHFVVSSDQDIQAARYRLSDENLRVAVLAVSCQFGSDARSFLDEVAALRACTKLVLAYDTTDEVSDVLAMIAPSDLSGQVSFLPSQIKIDASISILGLITTGQRYVSDSVLKLMLGDKPAVRRKPTGHAGIETLTARESQVIALLSEGAPNKLIAERLALSQSTVKLHIHHIIAKLGVHNRTEAAAAYHANGGAMDDSDMP